MFFSCASIPTLLLLARFYPNYLRSATRVLNLHSTQSLRLSTHPQSVPISLLIASNRLFFGLPSTSIPITDLTGFRSSLLVVPNHVSLLSLISSTIDDTLILPVACSLLVLSPLTTPARPSEDSRLPRLRVLVSLVKRIACLLIK